MAEAFLKLHILDLYHPVPDPITKDQHAKYRTKKSGVLCIHDFILCRWWSWWCWSVQLAETEEARLPIFPGQVIWRVSPGFNVQCADLERWMDDVPVKKANRKCIERNNEKRTFGRQSTEEEEVEECQVNRVNLFWGETDSEDCACYVRTRRALKRFLLDDDYYIILVRLRTNRNEKLQERKEKKTVFLG